MLHISMKQVDVTSSDYQIGKCTVLRQQLRALRLLYHGCIFKSSSAPEISVPAHEGVQLGEILIDSADISVHDGTRMLTLDT